MAEKDPSRVYPYYAWFWGFTWVPWFMMLSGYIQSYVALIGAADPKSQ
jgi:hypothetical protein